MAQDFAKSLYNSKGWIDLRINLIIDRGPVCEKCKKIIADTSKLIGHHKIKLTADNVINPLIALNPQNIELLCLDCHNAEPGHFSNLNSHTVYLIYGPPCSGKNTLVNQMMSRGDILLDMDKLYEAISGMPLYNKPDNLRFNVFALRDKVLDMIKTRYGKWHNAFVIGGYPNKAERERLVTELGAEMILREASYQECVERAGRDPTKGISWVQWINKWFAEYEA